MEICSPQKHIINQDICNKRKKEIVDMMMKMMAMVMIKLAEKINLTIIQNELGCSRGIENMMSEKKFKNISVKGWRGGVMSYKTTLPQDLILNIWSRGSSFD